MAWTIAVNLFLPNVFALLYAPGGIIEILWSIGIEEQFYLFVAPLIKYSRNTVIVLSVFSIVHFALCFSGLIPQLREFKMYYFYFSISSIVSILADKIKLNVAVKASLATIFMLYFFTDIFDFKNAVMQHLFAVIYFPIFIQSISYNPLFYIRNKYLNYFGKISYGIYMYHAIIMQLVILPFVKFKTHFGAIWMTAITTPVLIASTLIVAHLS